MMTDVAIENLADAPELDPADGAGLDGVQVSDQEETPTAAPVDNDNDGEPAGGESDDDVLIVEPEDEATGEPDDETVQAAPEWVKRLRQNHREAVKAERAKSKELLQLKKEVQQLKRQAVQIEPSEPEVAAPGAKPSLDAFEYDSEKYEAALSNWYEKKQQYESYQARQQEQQAAKQAEERERQEAWQNKLQQYQQKRDAFAANARDFDGCELLVQNELTETQQSMLIDGADDPAFLIYVLGKNPAKLNELAEIKNPLQFAFRVAKLEERAAMQKSNRPTKTPPSPERPLVGGAPKNTNIGKQLDAMRAKAEQTNDYSALISYKKQLRQKGIKF